MKIPVRVPETVKTCLLTLAAGMLALAMPSCSQTDEPELDETPVAEGAKPARSPRPKKKPRKKRSTPPALPMSAEEEELLPKEEVPAELFAPVVLPEPFVPAAPGKRISHLSVPGPYVAVTFDDGPSAAFTPQVLDIFARHGARATFFVQGQNAKRHGDILARAVAEGHEIGSHTWSHINMRSSSRDTIFRELDRTAAAIQKATGSRPKVMRPPYGAVNQSLINMVYKRYGTPAILWDVDTQDWRKPGVQTVINRAVGRATPGSIILLHDIHASTLEAVEGVVTGLQARGFTLVTVSELIAMSREAAGVATPEEEKPQPASPAAAPALLPLELPVGSAAIGQPVEPVVPVAPAIPVEDDFNFFEEP